MRLLWFTGSLCVPSMSDLDVVQRIYAAMAARDISSLFELLDPQCVITQDARLPWGGRFVGHDGFAAFGAALTGAISSVVTTDALFEADGDVIQYGRTRGTTVSGGQEFDIPEVHRWTVRDGRAIGAHFSIDTTAMLEALEGA
jgi:ketosteroid isomerase-like protein